MMTLSSKFHNHLQCIKHKTVVYKLLCTLKTKVSLVLKIIKSNTKGVQV
jgi:hypothetical protein